MVLLLLKTKITWISTQKENTDLGQVPITAETWVNIPNEFLCRLSNSSSVDGFLSFLSSNKKYTTFSVLCLFGDIGKSQFTLPQRISE